MRSALELHCGGAKTAIGDSLNVRATLHSAEIGGSVSMRIVWRTGASLAAVRK
jgi:hypothetical protein